jgi:hypothetical protein
MSETTNSRAYLDDVLYQFVVDEEFRDLLLADPGSFGVNQPNSGLPTAVEPLDSSQLGLASGVQFEAECRSTCTGGLITIICDGTTK